MNDPGIKHIALLGSTGSIGKNVLEVVRQYPGRFRVVALAAAGRNLDLLRHQIEAFNPLVVAVADEHEAGALVQSLPAGWGDRVLAGATGVERAACLPEADTVVSAIVGAAGLLPTLAAIEAGKNIALANKETLVMAGELVMARVQRHKVRLLPIDSEHSAIFQALEAGRRQDVFKLILTASGGPFHDWTMERLAAATPAQALSHPNWKMGQKITIDSATLMNKGLEVIEAKWLFDMALDDIEVVVHPQSIVHSLVEFIDGSVVAQLGVPDMKIPITYALSYPERLRGSAGRLDLARCQDLRFMAPDPERFPALPLAYQAGRTGGTCPAILNAANEVAVAAFLRNAIRFPEITRVVADTMHRLPAAPILDLGSVLDADLAARMQAESIIASLTLQDDTRTTTEPAEPCRTFSNH
ncbi:MAG: 1-deoxy-D-xylulose-5-phosphate reductoisomerase [Deltaproteobacteria bacterium CG23_combo_of_CG06-09_8_20_14_all_60_8]|nr:MAG: 1-deoxy-D-xylulose-5-phosphate reductoisomerase [Deltaproteobacteria bacterium CG23_combo_of_CG06-09_8_20_14_all_60_8]